MHMHLLSTINAGYEVPFRVALQSFVDQLEPDVSATWHVFQTGMPVEMKAAIETQAGGAPLTLCWYDFCQERLRDLPIRGRFIPHVYARIIAPELLPSDVGRFLYLDGDLLNLSGISALWNFDLEDAVIGAVPDMAVPTVSSPMGIDAYQDLGFAANEPYFNAGVYLVDCQMWRGLEVGRQAIDYIERFEDAVNLLDQEALNVALRGRWKRLDLRWNLIASLAGRRHFKSENIDSAEYQRAVTDPAIIHFAGTLKPWLHPRTASLWASRYLETLHRVFPGYRLSETVKARSFSFYDRRLRQLLYPVEKYVWNRRKGF